MPSVLVLNNYSIERVLEEVQRGDKPEHHLYGINRFSEHGYNVRVAPFRRYRILQMCNTMLRLLRFPVPLGDLDQQFSAWLLRKEVNLIYCPCQTQMQLLSYLRAVGLFKVPIITLAHHPLERGRLRKLRVLFLRWQLKGTDEFPSLSRGVAKEIDRLSGRSGWSTFIPWGPDLDYYPVASGPGDGALAVGRTGRDFATFGLAASAVGAKAHIICLVRDLQPIFQTFGKNVKVSPLNEECSITYHDLCRDFAKARVLAIPLSAGPSLSGLTSLTDALGVGRPMIMTRHPLVDLDIEAEGIGRWVAQGDVAGWESALRWFEQHPDEACEMGRNSRALAEKLWNHKTFTANIVGLFRRVLERTSNSKPFYDSDFIKRQNAE